MCRGRHIDVSQSRKSSPAPHLHLSVSFSMNVNSYCKCHIKLNRKKGYILHSQLIESFIFVLQQWSKCFYCKMVTTCFSSNIITQFLRHSGLIIEHWLTELICAGQENLWLSVMTHGPHYSRFPQSKLHDLKPNTSASRPTTQSISTFIIWDIRPCPYRYWKTLDKNPGYQSFPTHTCFILSGFVTS